MPLQEQMTTSGRGSHHNFAFVQPSAFHGTAIVKLGKLVKRAGRAGKDRWLGDDTSEESVRAALHSTSATSNEQKISCVGNDTLINVIIVQGKRPHMRGTYASDEAV